MKEVIARDVVKKFDSFVALKGVNLTAHKGEVTTLLGPSGCGKTTLLRCIAGLEAADGGEIRFGDEIVSDAKGSRVPAEKRAVGMVFQSYAVWPHMTVFENVAYGLTLRKRKKPEIKGRVGEVLDLVGLAGREDHYPSMLSGGQQQRVVLARALAYEPEILLLDEPLANLDAKLREHMRFELRQIQEKTGVTAIYVTHDQDEAMAISHSIVVMSEGEVQQVGPPAEVYERPVNEYVATFVGLANFLDVHEAAAPRHDGSVDLSTAIGPVRAVHRPEIGPAEKISIRPENFALMREPVSAVNSWKGVVEDSIFLGENTRYTVSVGDRKFRVHGKGSSRFAPGDVVFVEAAPEQVILLERKRDGS